MTYRGYEIRQQREFGPLRLLQWVESGDFIIVRNGGDAFGAKFRTIDDAKRAIDAQEGFFKRFGRALSN